VCVCASTPCECWLNSFFLMGVDGLSHAVSLMSSMSTEGMPAILVRRLLSLWWDRWYASQARILVCLVSKASRVPPWWILRKKLRLELGGVKLLVSSLLVLLEQLGECSSSSPSYGSDTLAASSAVSATPVEDVNASAGVSDVEAGSRHALENEALLHLLGGTEPNDTLLRELLGVPLLSR
jgi:hypothetical protein